MKSSRYSSKLITFLTLTAALAVGGFVGGCAATPTWDSTGEYVDDTAITTKVKAAFLRDDAVKTFEIKVVTVKGVVQLSGFVDNATQKSAAEADASAVANVRSVVNDIIVK